MKVTKRRKDINSKVDLNKEYSITEAVAKLKETSKTKFNESIDIAMKLGTNYPYGPFEWSKKIGLKNITALLNELFITEKRYQPADLLLKEAKEQ